MGNNSGIEPRGRAVTATWSCFAHRRVTPGPRLSVFAMFLALMLAMFITPVFITFPSFTFFLFLVELVWKLKEILIKFRRTIGVVIWITIIWIRIRVRIIIIRLSDSLRDSQIPLISPAAAQQHHCYCHNYPQCNEHLFHWLILVKGWSEFQDVQRNLING
jgi:hypothetical protein